jgi:hypothetical protein
VCTTVHKNKFTCLIFYINKNQTHVRTIELLLCRAEFSSGHATYIDLKSANLTKGTDQIRDLMLVWLHHIQLLKNNPCTKKAAKSRPGSVLKLSSGYLRSRMLALVMQFTSMIILV